MKKLYLVRHAKSSWKHDGVLDMDRPLKGRGIRDAYNSAQWLTEEDDLPQLILSSPATRALHTALIFAKGIGYPITDIRLVEELYEADIDDLNEVVTNLDDQYQVVMLFGHNPTITTFVNMCIDHRIDNVPTTGIACLKFDCEQWKDISHEAELIFFDYPKRHRKRS